MTEKVISDLKEEKERHSKNLKRIREKAGVQNLIELIEKNKNSFADYNKEKENLKEILYVILPKAISGKRFSAGNKISIREGGVYEYNTGIPADINDLYKYSKEYDLIEEISPEYEKSIRKVLEEIGRASKEIRNIQEYSRGFYLKEGNNYYILYRMSRVGNKICDSINLYENNSSGYRSLQKDKNSTVTRQDLRIDFNTKDEEKMKILMQESSYISDCIKESIKEIEKAEKSLREARESLISDLGREIISSKI